jgi:hypothetical protein
LAKDGGGSFKCLESAAWRQDSMCGAAPSDFMTTGESDAGCTIPPVPMGFVRWQQLRRIHEPEQRKELVSRDRDVYYIYCGGHERAPSTSGWTPFGKEVGHTSRCTL